MPMTTRPAPLAALDPESFAAPYEAANQARAALQRASCATFQLSLSADELANLPRVRRPQALAAVLAGCSQIEASLDAVADLLDAAEELGGADAGTGYIALGELRQDVRRARRLASCPGLTMERAG